MRKAFLVGALIVTGTLLLVPMIVMKVVEGVCFVCTITANSVRQAWKKSDD